jgi:hypothetical protein
VWGSVMSEDLFALHCAGQNGAHTRSRKRRGGPTQATDSCKGESTCTICNLSCLCARISLSECSALPAPNIILKILQILKCLVILDELSLYDSVYFIYNTIVSSLITHFLLHSYNHICVVAWVCKCLCACVCMCVYLYACLCMRVLCIYARLCVRMLYIHVCLCMRVLYLCYFCVFARGSYLYDSALPAP